MARNSTAQNFSYPRTKLSHPAQPAMDDANSDLIMCNEITFLPPYLTVTYTILSGKCTSNFFSSIQRMLYPLPSVVSALNPL